MLSFGLYSAFGHLYGRKNMNSKDELQLLILICDFKYTEEKF